VKKKSKLHISYVQDSILDMADYNSSSIVTRPSDIACFFPQVQETDLQQIFPLLLVKISGRCLK